MPRQPDPDPWDLLVLQVLRERDGVQTTVVLRDRRRLDVLDIAWGYDWGDVFSHITTNCSPGQEGLSMDVFWTSDVEAVVDPTSGTEILSRGRA